MGGFGHFRGLSTFDIFPPSATFFSFYWAVCKFHGRFGQGKQRKSKLQNLRHLNLIQITSRKKNPHYFDENCEGNSNFYQKSQNIIVKL